MIELKTTQTRDDGTLVYEPVVATIKVVTDKDITKEGKVIGHSRGFVFLERPNEGPETEWWNATAPTIKRNPHILSVKEGDRVTVSFVHGPQLDKETGQHNGKYWNNVNNMVVIEGSNSDQEETPTEPTQTTATTPDIPKRIDSFPKNLDYNVDRDNKIIMQVIVKAQVEFTNSLLSANSDISGIYENFEEVLKRNVEKSETMIDEVWNKRTEIHDWEIEE